MNEEQRVAVTHAGGPLLLIAGAGTGKTLTLCSRCAWLVAEGVAPERILLLTFTRRAAREMLARTRTLLGSGVVGLGDAVPGENGDADVLHVRASSGRRRCSRRAFSAGPAYRPFS